MPKHKSQPTGAQQTRKKSHSEDNSRAADSFQAGMQRVIWHPIFRPFYRYIYHKDERRCARGGIAVISNQGMLYAKVHPLMPPGDWSYTIAHCLLHLGLGHFREEKSHPDEWNAA